MVSGLVISHAKATTLDVSIQLPEFAINLNYCIWLDTLMLLMFNLFEITPE
jgi:hypothetical protein